MIIFTTLKQKDLAAVSAQQLFDHYATKGNQPTTIQRFEQYTITGDIIESELRQVIESTYIFSNPNKHHLLLDKQRFNPSHYYFNVSRKTPLNLTSKMIALSKECPNQTIKSVTMSELWGIQLAMPTETPNDLISYFIESTPSTIAPLAHPLIHTVSWVPHSALFDEITQPSQINHI